MKHCDPETQGKVAKKTHIGSEEGQWSEGLVSAARMVASATHSLCEAANSLVQGSSSEEKLIAAAKQVSAATAQLLLACKVKADPNSAALKRYVRFLRIGACLKFALSILSLIQIVLFTFSISGYFFPGSRGNISKILAHLHFKSISTVFLKSCLGSGDSYYLIRSSI